LLTELQYLVYCGWLGFELVFVMLFAVETRGKTPKEIAVFFDGKRKPGNLFHVDHDITAVSINDSSIPYAEQDESVTYVRKASAAEAYGLKKPHRVVVRQGSAGSWGQS
jgi:hypothetical protein